jgi:flavin-dependent thymidylate synthase
MPPQPLQVELVSHTANPIGTLYYIWMQSRTNEKLWTADDYERCARGHYTSTLRPTINLNTTAEEILNTVRELLLDDVPVLEHIHFSFTLKNASITLQRQLIRHRIGVKIADEQGLDIIPDLSDSSFWSQTARMVPNDDFYDEGRWLLPESIGSQPVSANDTAYQAYEQFIRYCQTLYRDLLRSGIPMEDARQVLPVAMTQDLVWTLSLKAIKHILGKRACWIAQYGLWGTLITQMAALLRNDVHPLFKHLVSPPCYTKGKWVGCPIGMINLDRMDGKDPYPPCPLWAMHQEQTQLTDLWGVIQPDITNPTKKLVGRYSDTRKEQLHAMSKQFEELWGIDPNTGGYVDPSAD